MNIESHDAPGLTSDIRGCLQSWGYDRFTEIQAFALAGGVAIGTSQVICAPTSSGKTLVAELAILAAICRGRRCLYLVSHKALADQKYLDFKERLGEGAQTPRASVGLGHALIKEEAGFPEMVLGDSVTRKGFAPWPPRVVTS